MKNRRKLLFALGAGVLARGSSASAQASANIRRIGLLATSSPDSPLIQAFLRGMRDLGWVEGKNIRIEYRYAEGRNERLPELAAELVRLKVDIIVTSTNPAAVAAQKASRTIPIVMAAPGDPVGMGLVESLARPGGNITGLSQMAAELTGKRLELLKETVPRLSRVAVLRNPQGATAALYLKELQLPARQLGVQLHLLGVSSANDLEKAFEEATKARAGALFVVANPVIFSNLKQIASLAIKNRLPSIFQNEEFADAGGLMAYGPDRADMYQRAATYVDKILKGAKAGDLPIERAAKFELIVNMKTAKALGLTIPPSVLVLATRVIE